MSLTALWFMVPARVKLYGAIFVTVLLILVSYNNKSMANAVAKYAEEVEDADQKRAANIRAAARDSVRSDTAGYRD